MFYFATRYKGRISQQMEKTLRAWHNQDPVDAEELERHEKVFEYQKVRNPFVDHPELVNAITDF